MVSAKGTDKGRLDRGSWQALKAPEGGSQRGQPGEAAQAGGLQLGLVWPTQCFNEVQNSG